MIPLLITIIFRNDQDMNIINNYLKNFYYPNNSKMNFYIIISIPLFNYLK